MRSMRSLRDHDAPAGRPSINSAHYPILDHSLRLLLIGIALVVLVAGAGCGRQDGKAAKRSGRPLAEGVESINIWVSDDHDTALPFWTSRGESNRILVHVDAHDDLRAIDATRLAPIVKAIASRNPTAVASLADNANITGAYNFGNFIYPAAKAGMVREVIWVVPWSRGEGAEGLAAWKSWLASQGYSDADVSSFEGDGSHLKGTMAGVPVTITTVDRFTAPNEPVLLDIDADFIPPYTSGLSSSNPLFGTRSLMLALQESGLTVRAATIASSINGNYLQADHRWLIAVLAESMLEPSLPHRDAPPERWALMGEAIAAESTDASRSIQLWAQAVETAPTDPATWYGFGRSLIIHGESAPDRTQGIAAVERAVEMEKAFAVGWLQIGSALSLSGNAQGIGFITRAKGQVPDFAYRIGLADAYYNLERFPEAIAEYRALSRAYTHPDAFMYLGDALLANGDTAEARAAYAQGLALMEGATFRSEADYPDALPTLASMALEDGDRDTAIRRFRLYLEIRPDGPEAANVTQQLENMGVSGS